MRDCLSHFFSGGQLFLFDKKKVKFRQDGVNWKKKKSGKAVRENHEQLKVGGVRVVRCFYTLSAGRAMHFPRK